MTSGIEVFPAFDPEGLQHRIFLMLTEWVPNGRAVQSRALTLSDAIELSKALEAAKEALVKQITTSPEVRSCRCGCDRPWTDPDSDDYLFAHVECDECGEEFPVDESFTERTQEYADGPITTQYYCPECCGDDRDPDQDMSERLSIDLTLGDF